MSSWILILILLCTTIVLLDLSSHLGVFGPGGNLSLVNHRGAQSARERTLSQLRNRRASSSCCVGKKK